MRNILSTVEVIFMKKSLILSNLCYPIVETAGQGRHSLVYKAKDPQYLGETVAVKEFRLSEGEAGKREEILFHKSARRIAGVKSHNLPRIDNFSIKGEKAYIVTNWLEGKRLPEYCKMFPVGISLHRTLTIIFQLAETLKAYHNNEPEIIHGDIKPDNIIISPNGTPQLADVPIYLRQWDINPATAYSPGFKAPEQVKNIEFKSTDIYSLCAVAFTLITGISPETLPPFCYPPIQKFRPESPDIVAALIEKGLRYNPELRYKNLSDLMDELSGCLAILPHETSDKKRLECPICKKPVNPSDPLCTRCNMDIGIYLGNMSSQTYYLKGIQIYNSGFHKKAERFFYQAQRLGAGEPEVLTYIALCSYRQGKTETAEKMLRNIIIRFPDNPNVLSASARILYEAGMKSAAFEMILWAERTNPDNTEVILAKTDFLLAGHETESALITVNEALEKDSASKDLLDLKSKVLNIMGRTGELGQFLINLPPSLRSAEMAYTAGKHLTLEGLNNDAIQVLTEAYGKAPHDPRITLLLAENYSKIGVIGEVPEKYVEALRFTGSDEAVINDAVAALLKCGLQTEALPFLFYLEKNSFADNRILLHIGLILVKNNFPDDGIKYLEKYTKIAQCDPAGWQGLSDAWIAKGDKDKALEAALKSRSIKVETALANKETGGDFASDSV
jgi:serine/threonine protein kinase